MAAKAIYERLDEALSAKMRECDRRVIAVRDDGRQGVALVAPNCIVISTVVCDGCIIDEFLN